MDDRCWHGYPGGLGCPDCDPRLDDRPAGALLLLCLLVALLLVAGWLRWRGW